MDGGLSGREPERSALQLQFRFLLRGAKVAATSALCDAVVLALGSVPRAYSFIWEGQEALECEFFEFPSASWTRGIKFFAQRKPFDFIMPGAELLARQGLVV